MKKEHSLYKEKIIIFSYMIIGFFPVHLCERGTTTAVYDYAYHNKKLLNNESIIFYKKNHPQNFPEYVKKFNEEFKCYEYDTLDEVENIILKDKIDAMYIIKYGHNDGLIFKNCKNLIHSVFVEGKHGDKYAFVSRWLSEKNGCNIPYVPHIIDLPEISENLREKLNIPSDALVFGGYGGKDSFNIPFVHDCINEIINENSKIYFLFMNFDKNTKDHNRIIYLPPTIDKKEKVKFINTCDAMIHARYVGETFGIAIGEFSSKNKPIITHQTFRDDYDKEHIRILGKNGFYYRNKMDLKKVIRDFCNNKIKGVNCYKDYEPEPIMKIFNDVFLS
ncbi:hypothetical protein Catovirus_1_737 [Catovirus CTV1]|uniref:Glycosyltransferase n=1 Tax=Catovirus CTV1 TaxID=1977631 RepID=A0A1V0SAE7_9VIRU|nr:hypothetical protein Catovirus_1_737 [Catovirus CTV1]